jgi:nitrite reductase/ring-hydroxylating ferredoxin subunit
MAMTASGSVRVGTLAELEQRGCMVVPAGGHTVAVFLHDGRVYALDNRCPHMGFPLSRGTVRDGLLTCHWHHARFDLTSGGTLDPFADDVRTFPVRVVDGEVFVEVPAGEGERVPYWTRRIEEGLEQQITLVLAKGVIALLGAGVPPAQIAAIGGRFGLQYRAAGWGPGMTILTACASVLPALAPEDRVPALVHGLARVAADCAGQPPRFPLEPLPGTAAPIARLKQWFRRAVEVRDEEAAERALATAIAVGGAPHELADMLLAAATDHFYLDDGHTLDFINKACEYLDLVGWQEAGTTLPALVAGLCRATRSEEQNAWRHPVDLVALAGPELTRLVTGALPAMADGGRTLSDEEFDGLVWTVLGEDPEATVRALSTAMRDGVALPELGLAVAHAAALRLARFHTSNEFGDWDTVHNTWTSCQALYQALRRAPSAELARGLYHAALRVYLDRFLNVPPQRLPDMEPEPPAAPTEPVALRQALLELMDREQQVNPVGRLVDAYLAAGQDDAALVQTLGHALFREDAGFHAYQAFEAGWRLFTALRARRPLAARRTLVGVARFLAAHSPTPRALRQTVTIAQRLARGEELYAEV